MIIIETFERGATPRYRPAEPTITIRIRHFMSKHKPHANTSARSLPRSSAGTGKICSDTQPTAQDQQQLTAFVLKTPNVVSPTNGFRSLRAAHLHYPASTAALKSP